MGDTKREQLAEQYRALGRDPEKIVLAQCRMSGCHTYVDVPYVDAAIGRIYCADHTIFRKALAR